MASKKSKRKGKRKIKMAKQTSPANPSTSSENCDNEIRYEFVLELSKEKYEYENQREHDLVQQAGQMQAVFSFVTAALFMALPIIIDHKGDVSLENIFAFSSLILFLLLLSFIFAAIAMWRWKYNTGGNITEIKQCVLESKRGVEYNSSLVQKIAIIDMLEKVQVKKEEINDKRAKYICASMISFFGSIVSIVRAHLIQPLRARLI